MPPKSNSLPALILGLCLIAAAAVGAYAFYRVKSFDNSLEVTGSAKMKITSDAVKWTSQFTREVSEPDLKTGYAQMAKDTADVVKFLRDNGVAEGQEVVSAVMMDQDYSKFQPGMGGPRQYILRQTVEVRSGEVAKITALAKDIRKLVDAGVIFSTQSLEYTYTKLPEARVSLLGDAVRDAKTRAENIASSGGKKVGTLKAASMGVVQVLPVNSTDVSDYGAYDTSNIEKEVMVTVRASFILE